LNEQSTKGGISTLMPTWCI